MNATLTDADLFGGRATRGGRAPLRTHAGVRTRIKICGLTRADDAQAACRFGADAVGLIFYPPSPRGVDPDRARAVRRVLPPFVTVVGVFVDPEPGFLRRVMDEVSLDLVQFHGDEEPGFCESFGRPYIKAVRMRDRLDLAEVARRYSSASALLLDSFDNERRGGTGETFDWTRVPPDLGTPFILAGGLGPENVAEAIAAVAPFAVDGNSGVESSPGIKDHAKIEKFIREVNRGEIA
ncbi:MAG: phosphoribosylanthranilate isomerase [Gammaproteobacteria bacterium]|nr:phosphoribosylanthranilate isomerase [Gammaproteobacteria bacterium]